MIKTFVAQQPVSDGGNSNGPPITCPPDRLEKAQHLLTIVEQYMTPAEVKQVRLALELAWETCVLDKSVLYGAPGTRLIPPFEQALAVAAILAEIMHADAIGVAAGLVFEAVDAGRLPLDQLENKLGTSVARVVGSMLHLSILERKKRIGATLAGVKTEVGRDKSGGQSVGAINRPLPSVGSREGEKKRRNREALREQQAETVRKMFFAMAEDPRVVLLKLAYQLHAMRVLRDPAFSFDHHEMQLLAQETREIYAPLAGRLGVSRVESELEDLAFAILEPEKYAWIRDQVEAESEHWRTYVERVCAILREEMQKIGLRAEVSGRVKHLYSLYKKLRRRAGEADRLEDLKAAAELRPVYDLIAFRILVESTPDCYKVLGHVHSLWKPREGSIKDYIAKAKPNGYRSLHTTVFCLDNQLAEIQIRTFEMHEMAEYGVAIHWHYKEVGNQASASARELLTWLRQLAEWQRELRTTTSDADFVQAVKDDIFQEQIFVFTPKGEVKDLPVGSTPIDFAYRIHSKIGDRCAGARIITISGTGESERLVTRMVPLDYELKSGEIVDIVTSRTAHPTRDWLKFARTAAARSKIRRYLKTYERDINIQIGRERLDRKLKELGARGIEVLTEEMQNWLANEHHVPSFEDVLAAIGGDEVRPHAVAVKLFEHWPLREQGESRGDEQGAINRAPTDAKQTSPAHLEVAGVSGLLTSLANCCCPLPGDEIVGFISRGKGAIVHRADCPNIGRYRERDRERLIHVSWTGMSQQRYQAPIIILAHDRQGLIRDIAAAVSEAGVNMTSVSSNVGADQKIVPINATLEIESLEQMERLFARLERIKGVLHVERNLGRNRKRS